MKTAERLAWDKLRETEPYKIYKKYLFKKQKRRCYYCHKKLTEIIVSEGLIGFDENYEPIFAPRYFMHSEYGFDHKLPISKGGSNLFSNLVISCSNCNSRKQAKLDWSYA